MYMYVRYTGLLQAADVFSPTIFSASYQRQWKYPSYFCLWYFGACVTTKHARTAHHSLEIHEKASWKNIRLCCSLSMSFVCGFWSSCPCANYAPS